MRILHRPCSSPGAGSELAGSGAGWAGAMDLYGVPNTHMSPLPQLDSAITAPPPLGPSPGSALCPWGHLGQPWQELHPEFWNLMGTLQPV